MNSVDILILIQSVLVALVILVFSTQVHSCAIEMRKMEHKERMLQIEQGCVNEKFN